MVLKKKRSFLCVIWRIWIVSRASSASLSLLRFCVLFLSSAACARFDYTNREKFLHIFSCLWWWWIAFYYSRRRRWEKKSRYFILCLVAMSACLFCVELTRVLFGADCTICDTKAFNLKQLLLWKISTQSKKKLQHTEKPTWKSEQQLTRCALFAQFAAATKQLSVAGSFAKKKFSTQNRIISSHNVNSSSTTKQKKSQPKNSPLVKKKKFFRCYVMWTSHSRSSRRRATSNLELVCVVWGGNKKKMCVEIFSSKNPQARETGRQKEEKKNVENCFFSSANDLVRESVEKLF